MSLYYVMLSRFRSDKFSRAFGQDRGEAYHREVERLFPAAVKKLGSAERFDPDKANVLLGVVNEFLAKSDSNQEQKAFTGVGAAHRRQQTTSKGNIELLAYNSAPLLRKNLQQM